MSHRVGDVLTLKKEPAQQCDFCGQIRELRPYGPNGECLCFDCAMQDEESAKRQFAARMAGSHRIDKALAAHTETGEGK